MIETRDKKIFLYHSPQLISKYPTSTEKKEMKYFTTNPPENHCRRITLTFFHQYFRFNFPALVVNCEAPVCSISVYLKKKGWKVMKKNTKCRAFVFLLFTRSIFQVTEFRVTFEYFVEIIFHNVDDLNESDNENAFPMFSLRSIRLTWFTSACKLSNRFVDWYGFARAGSWYAEALNTKRFENLRIFIEENGVSHIFDDFPLSWIDLQENKYGKLFFSRSSKEINSSPSWPCFDVFLWNKEWQNDASDKQNINNDEKDFSRVFFFDQSESNSTHWLSVVATSDSDEPIFF